MKKFATRLLYVFSFSLLFTALYLNFIQGDKSNTSLLRTEKKAESSPSSIGKNSAVAQPEDHTVLK